MFSGTPFEIVSKAFAKKFQVVLSKPILNELETNLVKKFEFTSAEIQTLFKRILEVADLYEPMGKLHLIKNHVMDNLVIETAVLGDADFLVTGDKKHLLPIGSYGRLKIVDPATFAMNFRP